MVTTGTYFQLHLRGQIRPNLQIHNLQILASVGVLGTEVPTCQLVGPSTTGLVEPTVSYIYLSVYSFYILKTFQLKSLNPPLKRTHLWFFFLLDFHLPVLAYELADWHF